MGSLAGGEAVVLLANPNAGGGKASEVARRAVRTLARLGVEARMVLPRREAEAAEAVRAAVLRLESEGRRLRALVAVGGDGTVRRAAVLAGKAGLPLGIIPAGTGNGAAYSLGLPLDPGEACRIVTHGLPRAIDLGRVEFPGGGSAPGGDGAAGTGGPERRSPELFVNVAGAGLDAAISRAYEVDRTGPRGVPGYVLAALRSLATSEPVPLELGLDGETREFEALLVAIGNGAFYGKGIRIAPPASPSDGLLDVVVVLAAGPAEISALVPLLLLGRHTGHPKVRTFRAREVTVAAGAGTVRPVPVHADGDTIGELPVRVSVVPGGIDLLGPKPEGRFGRYRAR